MPIKRRVTTREVTEYEMDDSSDIHGKTSSPKQLTPDPIEYKERGLTGIPKDDAKEETDLSQETPKSYNKPTFGRTWPDLISEFFADPRAIATTLMSLPIFFFVFKIDSIEILKISLIETLKIPLMVGVILNIVWFGAALITNLWRRIWG